MKLIIIVFILSVLGGMYWYNKTTGNEMNDQDLNSQQNIVEQKHSGFGGLITPADFLVKMNSGEYIVLDVRTFAEYMSGRIEKNATSVDYYSSSFKEQLNNLEKDKKYLIYCQSGNRSSKTVAIMEELEFENFYELEGGISNWNLVGMEVLSGE
jgi:rhodanese-related sulfurtransferase